MATYFLDPNEDVLDEFPIKTGEGTTGWGVLRKYKRAPTSPSSSSYVGTTTTGSLVVGFDSFNLAKVSTAETIQANFYWTSGGAGSAATISLIVDNSVVATTSKSGVSAGEWVGISASSSSFNQEAIDSIRVLFESTGSASINIHAVYCKVTTTDTALVFTEPSLTYTPYEPKRWRPNIRPGAFWI